MELPKDIATCHLLIKVLLEQNQELAKRIAELESRLDQNSSNSNRPPSSDGLKKRIVKPAFPIKKGKKRGGQEGHKGKTLEFVSAPDHLMNHAPARCSCGYSLDEVAKQTIESRQVFDLPEPKLEVTEHRLQSCVCPNCDRVNVGQFPKQVPAYVQYGARVRSLAVLLNVGFKLSHSRIRQFFGDVFGYHLNESTQISSNKKCYHALSQSEEMIKQKLLDSPVNHFDETGLRVAGKTHWLHNCSNESYTYWFIHSKRGKIALRDEPSLIPNYEGWAVHDCWPSYFHFDQCKHAICGAHLLRELQGLIEQKSIWADRMRDLLLYAYHKSDKGKSVVRDFGFITRQYERFCRMGEKEEPPPVYNYKNKRSKKTKGRNLLERLIKHQDGVLAFAQFEEVPFTNNQAERDVRPAKIKQKMAGCLRTFNGAQIYARIQGFISTTRKHQLNVFNELVATFSGHNFLVDPEGC